MANDQQQLPLSMRSTPFKELAITEAYRKLKGADHVQKLFDGWRGGIGAHGYIERITAIAADAAGLTEQHTQGEIKCRL